MPLLHWCSLLSSVILPGVIRCFGSFNFRHLRPGDPPMSEQFPTWSPTWDHSLSLPIHSHLKAFFCCLWSSASGFSFLCAGDAQEDVGFAQRFYCKALALQFNCHAPCMQLCWSCPPSALHASHFSSPFHAPAWPPASMFVWSAQWPRVVSAMSSGNLSCFSGSTLSACRAVQRRSAWAFGWSCGCSPVTTNLIPRLCGLRCLTWWLVLQMDSMITSAVRRVASDSVRHLSDSCWKGAPEFLFLCTRDMLVLQLCPNNRCEMGWLEHRSQEELDAERFSLTELGPWDLAVHCLFACFPSGLHVAPRPSLPFGPGSTSLNPWFCFSGLLECCLNLLGQFTACPTTTLWCSWDAACQRIWIDCMDESHKSTVQPALSTMSATWNSLWVEKFNVFSGDAF